MKLIRKLKELNNKEYELDKWTKAMIILLIFSFGGIFGFIYETFFYRIDLGYFVKRGTTFGPWIPIYGFGGVFITILTYKFRKKPIVIFLLACLISGILEFTVGYLLFNLKGIRLWDYNEEIWNFGNIGGYICFRSIMFFGLSSLFLIYFVIPIFKNWASKCKKSIFSLIALIPGVLFAVDITISNLVMCFKP